MVAGTDDTDAVNVSQLNSALKGAKHTEVTLNGDAPTAGANGALGSYIGDSNLTMAVQEVDGQKVYDLKMSKDLVAGTKPGADGRMVKPEASLLSVNRVKTVLMERMRVPILLSKTGRKVWMDPMASRVSSIKMKVVKTMKSQRWMMA